MPAMRNSGLAQKGCICHAILNERESLFPNTTDIYIYIYIYMKADKGVGKLNFVTLCLHVKESCKACEESNKAP